MLDIYVHQTVNYSKAYWVVSQLDKKLDEKVFYSCWKSRKCLTFAQHLTCQPGKCLCVIVYI